MKINPVSNRIITFNKLSQRQEPSEYLYQKNAYIEEGTKELDDLSNIAMLSAIFTNVFECDSDILGKKNKTNWLSLGLIITAVGLWIFQKVQENKLSKEFDINWQKEKYGINR